MTQRASVLFYVGLLAVLSLAAAASNAIDDLRAQRARKKTKWKS